MTENDDSKETSSLKTLVEHYQQTKAPLGFAERVAAHAREESATRRMRTPAWLYAASFAVVIVCSVVVLNVLLQSEPELQLARQDKSQPDIRSPVNAEQQNAVQKSMPVAPDKISDGAQPMKDKQPAQETQLAEVAPPPVATQAKHELPEKQEKPESAATQMATVVVATEINPNWDQPEDDNDFTSVAVLWDVSDWLDDGAVASPDFSEMPALGDIEALFEAS